MRSNTSVKLPFHFGLLSVAIAAMKTKMKGLSGAADLRPVTATANLNSVFEGSTPEKTEKTQSARADCRSPYRSAACRTCTETCTLAGSYLGHEDDALEWLL